MYGKLSIPFLAEIWVPDYPLFSDWTCRCPPPCASEVDLRKTMRYCFSDLSTIGYQINIEIGPVFFCWYGTEVEVAIV